MRITPAVVGSGTYVAVSTEGAFAWLANGGSGSPGSLRNGIDGRDLSCNPAAHGHNQFVEGVNGLDDSAVNRLAQCVDAQLPVDCDFDLAFLRPD